jgi:hypothetical protein
MREGAKIILLILLTLVITESQAQLIPNFGGQRAGLSTLSFLKNDMNPRSVGMSGASVAISGDGYSSYSNPAATTEIKAFNLSLSNFNLGAGIQQSYLSVLIPRKNKLGTFGVTMNMLNSGSMEVRTEFQPDGTGEKFYVTNLALGFSYAQKLSDMFSAGISMKYINEQIDSYTNSTVAADLSFLYFTDYKDLKFAVMIQNFGGNSSIDGDELQSTFNRTDPIEPEEYSVPTVFSLGASIVPFKKEKQSLMASIQLNHPNDNAENYRIGLEYEYLKLLYLRGGIKINVDGQKFPSFGFGLRHRIGGHPLQINYAANPTEYLGLLHTVGLSFTLNEMKR